MTPLTPKPAGYEVMPMPELTVRQLQAIVERHALDLDGP
jgi:hypothetical protein